MNEAWLFLFPSDCTPAIPMITRSNYITLPTTLYFKFTVIWRRRQNFRPWLYCIPVFWFLLFWPDLRSQQYTLAFVYDTEVRLQGGEIVSVPFKVCYPGISRWGPLEQVRSLVAQGERYTHQQHHCRITKHVLRDGNIKVDKSITHIYTTPIYSIWLTLEYHIWFCCGIHNLLALVKA